MERIVSIKFNIFYLLLSVSIGFCQDVYFVAMNGNNLNSGVFEQPWQSIQYAVDQVQAGDTLNIRAGIYTEKILITTSGTKHNPIVIKSFDNEVVKIDARNESFGIILDECHCVTISGLTIFGATKSHSSGEQSNLYLIKNSSHIIIQQCELYDGKYGIYSQPEPTYITIIDCKIHDNESEGIGIRGRVSGNNIIISGNYIYSNGKQGIFMKCDSSIIEKNNIYDNGEEGIYMKQGSSKVRTHNIIRKNQIFNNYKHGIVLTSQYTLIYENDIHDNGSHPSGNRHAHGIYMAQSSYNIIYNNEMHDNHHGSAVRLEGNYNVVTGNLFYNNGTGMYSTDNYGPECYCNIIRNNYIYGNRASEIGPTAGSGLESDGTEELRLYNNVFFDNDGYGTAFVTGIYNLSSGIKIKNNIIMNNGWEHIMVKKENEEGYEESHNNIFPDKADAINFTGNIYWLADYKKTTSQGVNTISQDPLFVAYNDFHLTSNSPCIDAGVFLTTTSSSGDGTRIPVHDVMYFCDGHGLTQGDLIQLEGGTQKARITIIDYENKILTIDQSLSWTTGQGVSLPYNGLAPDIGVDENFTSVDIDPPLPPQNVTIELAK